MSRAERNTCTDLKVCRHPQGAMHCLGGVFASTEHLYHSAEAGKFPPLPHSDPLRIRSGHLHHCAGAHASPL